MELGFGVDEHQALAHLGNTARKHTAIVGAPVAHDLVAALAFQIRCGEPTREGLGKDVHLLFGRAKGRIVGRNDVIDALTGNGSLHPVDNGAVHAHYRLHVLGRFHAPLHLQRGNARLQKLGDEVRRAQVLRRKQVLTRSVEVLAQSAVMELVRQTASLGATAAVRRAASHHGRHKALAGIADAQGTMGEGFQLNVKLLGKLVQTGDLGQGKLASKRYAGSAQSGSRTQPILVMNVHLGGYVHLHIGHDARELDGDADILNDESVDAAAIRLSSKLQCIGKLGGKHHRVQRQVDLHAAQVRVVAGFCQVFEREVVGPSAGVEMPRTQVHRIGTGLHRSMQARHVAGRSQQLHFLRAIRCCCALGLHAGNSVVVFVAHIFCP